MQGYTLLTSGMVTPNCQYINTFPEGITEECSYTLVVVGLCAFNANTELMGPL